MLLTSWLPLNAQYTYEFEYESPNPALEFCLNESFEDDTYYVIVAEPDSLYLNLLNSEDSFHLFMNVDIDYSFELSLFNRSFLSPHTDNTSNSFSKTGVVIGHENSMVYGHFSPEYFWIEIVIDTLNISIYPIRSHNESFSEYSDIYILTNSIEEYSTSSSNECDDLFVDVYTIADRDFYNRFSQDENYILDNTISHLMRIEKFLNQTFRPQSEDGNIYMRLLFNIDLDMNMFNTDEFEFEAVRDEFAKHNRHYYPCFFPDLYLGLTGLNLGYGGMAHLGTACEPIPSTFLQYPDLPGLSLVNFYNTQFEYSANLANKATTKIAHEILHQFGANDLSGSSACGFDCTSLEHCSLMCTEGCNRFVLDNCSKNSINGHFNNDCNDCYLSFYDPEDCLHCEYTGRYTQEGEFPLIPLCDERNEFTIQCSFINNCDPLAGIFQVSYNSTQVELLDLGDFNEDIDIFFDERLLVGTKNLAPEEEVVFKARFRLIDNPADNPIDVVVTSLSVLESGNSVPIFIVSNNKMTYLFPENINENYDLSQLLEPQNGYLFEDDNVTDCSVTNKAFRLNGTLNIDSDYCLNNTIILMDASAKIIVKDGYTLTVNKDKIFGCEDMWDGIVVEEGGELIINESNIEDALIAVKLEENTSFTTTETRYHNNNIAIQAELSQPGDIDFQMLAGNSITADDVLSKEPLIDERAKAGIWFANVNEAIIEGEPPHIAPGMNTIGNLSNGIVLFNTDASIHNFHLYDIESDSPQTWIEDDQPDGHAIYINGSAGNFTSSIGSVETRDNYINGSQTGIFVKDANVDIQYCNIHNAMSAIVLGYKPRGESTITNNLINARNRGIQLRLPASLEANISNNRIQMTTASGIGIESLSAWGDVTIDDNTIFLHQSREGISLTDCRNTQISDNRIIFEEISSKLMKGISLEASSLCSVMDNTIIGKNINHNTVGIYLQDSPLNSVLCNTTRMTNVCNQFSGINSMTYYQANTHSSSDYGLLLGSDAIGSDAIIGRQSHKQNTWPLTNYGSYAAWNISEDINIITESLFTVDESKFPYYPPNISDLVNLGWFIHEPINEYSFDCQNRPVDPYPDMPEVCCDFSGANDTLIAFDVYPEVKNHHLRSQLYSAMLVGEVDSMISVGLYGFYLRSDTMDYGRFAKARQLFELSVTEEPNLRENLITTALNKSNSITGTADFLLYEKEANELLAEYLAEGDIETLISDKENLEEIALLCPYEYGAGVYMNRAWLRAIDLGSNFDETDACGAIEPRSTEESVSSLSFPSRYIIYPNPASVNDEIIIRSNNIIARVIVSDVAGKCVLREEPLVKESTEMGLALKKSGLYFISVWDKGNRNQFFKLFILD